MSICIGSFEIRVCFDWNCPEIIEVHCDEGLLMWAFSVGPLVFARHYFPEGE